MPVLDIYPVPGEKMGYWNYYASENCSKSMPICPDSERVPCDHIQIIMDLNVTHAGKIIPNAINCLSKVHLSHAVQ